jgi:hypothetical protein
LSVIVLIKVSFKALSTSNVNVFFIVKSILRGVDLSERDAVDLLLPSGVDFGFSSNAKLREDDLVAFSDDSVLSFFLIDRRGVLAPSLGDFTALTTSFDFICLGVVADFHFIFSLYSLAVESNPSESSL